MGSIPAGDRLHSQTFDITPPRQRPEPEFIAQAKRVYPDLESLFDAGEHVANLMSHPGWNLLARVLEASMADIDARLDGQLLATRSDYAREHGKRAGLRAMTEAARAIVGEAERQRAKQQAKYEVTAESVALGA